MRAGWLGCDSIGDADGSPGQSRPCRTACGCCRARRPRSEEMATSTWSPCRLCVVFCPANSLKRFLFSFSPFSLFSDSFAAVAVCCKMCKYLCICICICIYATRTQRCTPRQHTDTPNCTCLPLLLFFFYFSLCVCFLLSALGRGAGTGTGCGALAPLVGLHGLETETELNSESERGTKCTCTCTTKCDYAGSSSSS